MGPLQPFLETNNKNKVKLMFENKLSVLFLILVCYFAGRMHQWWRHTGQRELEFRRGYDSGSRSLFGIATVLMCRARGIARVKEPAGSTRCSRHSLEDRGAVTTRLNPGGER